VPGRPSSWWLTPTCGGGTGSGCSSSPTTDVDRAERESPTGATIAHGFLTLSTLAGMTMQLGVIPADASQALNYGIDRARFLTPVTSGQRIRTHVTLAGAEQKPGGRVLLRITCTVEIEGEPKPAVCHRSAEHGPSGMSLEHRRRPAAPARDRIRSKGGQ
jgi:hypothetical protein